MGDYHDFDKGDDVVAIGPPASERAISLCMPVPHSVSLSFNCTQQPCSTACTTARLISNNLFSPFGRSLLWPAEGMMGVQGVPPVPLDPLIHSAFRRAPRRSASRAPCPPPGSTGQTTRLHWMVRHTPYRATLSIGTVQRAHPLCELVKAMIICRSRSHFHPHPAQRAHPAHLIDRMSLLRTIRNIRQVGLKQYWRDLQYIGDAKAGTLVGIDS